MATTEELLASAADEEESTVLSIDWDTREITIPDSITQLGVESDEDTTRLYFSCPATYGEFDISTFGLRINYRNYNSNNSIQASDMYYVEDAESDGETITFSWLVGRNAYTSKGKTAFIVCGKLLDEDGEITNEINTTIAYLAVLEGLETTEAVVASSADAIDQIWAALENVGQPSAEDIAAALESYLEENPIDTYTLPVANSTTLGGVMPVAQTADMTQAVGVDDTGRLYTVPPDSGEDGKSAYEYAVEGGYTGTEEEFAAKLAGELPETLPNPYALTFTGAAEGSYDGSEAMTVEIPESSGSASEWETLCSEEQTLEGVTSAEFALSSTDAHDEYMINLYIAQHTGEDACSGNVGLNLNGAGIGYYISSYNLASTAQYFIFKACHEPFGHIEFVKLSVSPEFNAGAMYIQNSFGSETGTGVFKMTFPAAYTGSVEVEIYGR